MSDERKMAVSPSDKLLLNFTKYYMIQMNIRTTTLSQRASPGSSPRHRII